MIFAQCHIEKKEFKLETKINLFSPSLYASWDEGGEKQVPQPICSVNNHICLVRLKPFSGLEGSRGVTRNLCDYNTATLSAFTQTRKRHGGKLDPNTPSLSTFGYCLFSIRLFLRSTCPESQLLCVQVFSPPQPVLSPLPEPSQGSQTLSLITSFPCTQRMQEH